MILKLGHDLAFSLLDRERVCASFDIIQADKVRQFLANQPLLSFLRQEILILKNDVPVRGPRLTVTLSADEKKLYFTRQLSPTTLPQAAALDLAATLKTFVMPFLPTDAINVVNWADIAGALGYLPDNIQTSQFAITRA